MSFCEVSPQVIPVSSPEVPVSPSEFFPPDPSFPVSSSSSDVSVADFGDICTCGVPGRYQDFNITDYGCKCYKDPAAHCPGCKIYTPERCKAAVHDVCLCYATGALAPCLLTRGQGRRHQLDGDPSHSLIRSEIEEYLDLLDRDYPQYLLNDVFGTTSAPHRNFDYEMMIGPAPKHEGPLTPEMLEHFSECEAMASEVLRIFL